ncbi:hypothetical protein D5S18_23520 [Nocardia panacis]|uniref:Uncharacterized protein n=2 Tax=Nocardia panacis TaxID=2340916 RepID=A0A3A4KDL7_9NOCA|nr:hypothetical protein D5S18_23520 [Nocardia panacis]
MAAVALLAVGGCGPEKPQETAIPIDRLDVGNYPTAPRQFGGAKNIDQARLVAAERLADAVPPPVDIDRRFVVGAPFVASVWIDPIASLGKIMKINRFAEAAPDFVAGVTSFGSTEKFNHGMDLLNAVMIFPDERRAAEAAAALERVDFEANNRNTPVSIPKYPGAHAHWWPEAQSIGSWFATGKYVVYTWMYDYAKIFLKKVDQPELIGMVEKSLDAVVPAISAHPPIRTEQPAEVQVDRDGLLARTLPRPREDDWLNPPGVYEGRTALLFDDSPAKSRKPLTDAGVDRFTSDGAQVFRARDAAAARALRAERGGLSKKFKSAASPRNLPGAQCIEYIGREQAVIRFYCSVAYDRYAAFSWSNQLLDAQQRISAQYALLAHAG